MRTKSKSKTPNLFYCFVAVFALKLFYLPADLSLFSLDSFSFNTAQLALSVYAICITFLISAVYAVIIHKLLKLRTAVTDFCTALLVVDPFFRYSILIFEYGVLLFTALILCIYFVTGKSLNVKSVLLGVFVFISVLLDSTAIFCQIPLVSLAYGFNLLPTENELLNPVGKISKKQMSANRRLVTKKRVTLAAVFAVLIVLPLILKTYLLGNVLNQFRNFFAPIQVFSFFTNRRLFAVSVPYLGLLSAFTAKYLLKKSGGKKESVGFAFDNARFLWFSLPLFAMIFAGIWRYPQSIGICSLMCTAAIILIFLCDTETSAELTAEFSSFYRKHKIFISAVFIAYFFIIQYIFKDMQITVLDSIMSVAGSRQ